MHYRAIAILVIFCFSFAGGGCESLFQPSKPKSKSSKKKKQYEEVLMPLQTGSTLQRRAYVVREPDAEPKKKSKKKESSPKPEAEPAETPPTEEEPSPPPERFR